MYYLHDPDCIFLPATSWRLHTIHLGVISIPPVLGPLHCGCEYLEDITPPTAYIQDATFHIL